MANSCETGLSVSGFSALSAFQAAGIPVPVMDYIQVADKSGAEPKGRRYGVATHVPSAICALLDRIPIGVKSGLVLLPRYFPV